MGRDDDESWVDREKLSFSELDRRRREGGSSDRPPPRDPAAKQREAAATRQYLKGIEGAFSQGQKNEIADLATAMQDAHGTPGLADACRAYLAAAGLPQETPLISLFLDAADRELILAGLDALREACDGGKLKPTGGLQSQLRILAEDSDDDVAEGAEELLERL